MPSLEGTRVSFLCSAVVCWDVRWDRRFWTWMNGSKAPGVIGSREHESIFSFMPALPDVSSNLISKRRARWNYCCRKTGVDKQIFLAPIMRLWLRRDLVWLVCTARLVHINHVQRLTPTKGLCLLTAHALQLTICSHSPTDWLLTLFYLSINHSIYYFKCTIQMVSEHFQIKKQHQCIDKNIDEQKVLKQIIT